MRELLELTQLAGVSVVALFAALVAEGFWQEVAEYFWSRF